MTSTPRPRQVRTARPTDRLDAVAAFYRDALGLPELARFEDHAGYSGVILGLPGPDRQLEITAHRDGSPCPAPTRDNLLVLYLDGPVDVARAAGRLAGHGHRPVDAENPYWAGRSALTFEDPDGWRVVLVPQPAFDAAPDDAAPDDADPDDADPDDAGPEPTVAWHEGDREPLRPLFELAEDSPAALAAYLPAGRVLVARAGDEVVGHLQVVDGHRPGVAEIMNMAVREDLQGHGIGRRLVEAALAALATEGVAVVEVATATADIGNLRFYQRLGFRLAAVERDAFTPATGYPPGIRIDGVPLLDRVRLDLRLGPSEPEPGTA